MKGVDLGDQGELKRWIKSRLGDLDIAKSNPEFDPAGLSEYVILLLNGNQDETSLRAHCQKEMADFLFGETAYFVKILFAHVSPSSSSSSPSSSHAATASYKNNDDADYEASRYKRNRDTDEDNDTGDTKRDADGDRHRNRYRENDWAGDSGRGGSRRDRGETSWRADSVESTSPSGGRGGRGCGAGTGSGGGRGDYDYNNDYGYSGRGYGQSQGQGQGGYGYQQGGYHTQSQYHWQQQQQQQGYGYPAAAGSGGYDYGTNAPYAFTGRVFNPLLHYNAAAAVATADEIAEVATFGVAQSSTPAPSTGTSADTAGSAGKDTNKGTAKLLLPQLPSVDDDLYGDLGGALTAADRSLSEPEKQVVTADHIRAGEVDGDEEGKEEGKGEGQGEKETEGEAASAAEALKKQRAELQQLRDEAQAVRQAKQNTLKKNITELQGMMTRLTTMPNSEAKVELLQNKISLMISQLRELKLQSIEAAVADAALMGGSGAGTGDDVGGRGFGGRGGGGRGRGDRGGRGGRTVFRGGRAGGRNAFVLGGGRGGHSSHKLDLRGL